MKKINENTLREFIRETKEEYEDFFASKLKAYNVDSPADLSDEEKRKFFDEIDKEWNSEEESGTDGLTENVKYNFKKMKKFIEQDDFLTFAFKSNKGSDDEKTESLFNSHILGNKDMEKEYKSFKG